MKIKYPIEDPHTMSVEEVLQSFQSDVVAGISHALRAAAYAQARTRQRKKKSKSVLFR